MAAVNVRTNRLSSSRAQRDRKSVKPARLVLDLAALPSLSHQTLKERWAEMFGVTVPAGLSRRLMIYALAYEQQAQQSGRLKPHVRQQLQELAGVGISSLPVRTALAPGTRLMREWRGTVHVVDVTDDGLVWNGRLFKSLSAIARTITGTRWSGHRFFGLRKRSDAPPMATNNRIRSAAADTPSASDLMRESSTGPEEPKPPSIQDKASTKSDISQPPRNIGAKNSASGPPDNVGTAAAGSEVVNEAVEADTPLHPHGLETTS